jgi:tetratricopeptide (TPR) repeat protein
MLRVAIASLVFATQTPAGQSDFLAGRAALAQRRWSEAAGRFEAAVRADSTSAIYLFWLGRAYAEQARHGSMLEQLAAARRVKPTLLRAISADPGFGPARYLLVEFFGRAPAMVGGSGEAAAAHADTLLRIDPYLGGLARARLKELGRDSAGARAELRRLSASYPDSIGPYAQLFNLLSDSAGYREGLELAARIAKRKCCVMLSKYYVGRFALFSGKDLRQGADALRAYLTSTPREEEPSLAYAHWRLGQILERLGRPAEARREYEAAVALDPDLSGARRDLERLGRG